MILKKVCPSSGRPNQRFHCEKGLIGRPSLANQFHAKCLTFKDDGEEATVDYGKILGYLKAVNYKGAISIEFEGGGDPVEGVKKSRDLIIKHWN